MNQHGRGRCSFPTFSSLCMYRIRNKLTSARSNRQISFLFFSSLFFLTLSYQAEMQLECSVFFASQPNSSWPLTAYHPIFLEGLRREDTAASDGDPKAPSALGSYLQSRANLEELSGKQQLPPSPQNSSQTYASRRHANLTQLLADRKKHKAVGRL